MKKKIVKYLGGIAKISRVNFPTAISIQSIKVSQPSLFVRHGIRIKVCKTNRVQTCFYTLSCTKIGKKIFVLKITRDEYGNIYSQGSLMFLCYFYV